MLANYGEAVKFELMDWHMRTIGQGTVGADGVLKVPNDKPVYCVQLTR